MVKFKQTLIALAIFSIMPMQSVLANEANVSNRTTQIPNNPKNLSYSELFYQEAMTRLKTAKSNEDYQVILNYLTFSADQKNPLAIYELAKLYLAGNGTSKNYIKANELLTEFSFIAKANKLSYGDKYLQEINRNYPDLANYQDLVNQPKTPDVLYQMGLLFEAGDIVPQDMRQAENFFLTLANQNHLDSINHLAELYQNGDKVQQNYPMALNWIEKGIKLGDVRAERRLILFYANGWGVEKDINKALELYKGLATKGDLEAQYQLGHHYLLGDKGLEKNVPQAIFWFDSAYKAGHIESGLALAKIYSSSFNEKKSLEIYRSLANKGDQRAQYAYGTYYVYGRQVDQNFEEAIEWFEKAEQQDHIEAAYALAMLYLHGKGVQQSYEKAFHYLKKASDAGNSQAQLQIAGLYLYGLGTDKNADEALKLLRASATQGNLNAAFNLAYLLASGKEVAQNETESFQWMKFAASSGHKEAQYFLGVFLAEGFAGESDVTQAIKWLSLSCDKAHKEACDYAKTVKNRPASTTETVNSEMTLPKNEKSDSTLSLAKDQSQKEATQAEVTLRVEPSKNSEKTNPAVSNKSATSVQPEVNVGSQDQVTTALAIQDKATNISQNSDGKDAKDSNEAKSANSSNSVKEVTNSTDRQTTQSSNTKKESDKANTATSESVASKEVKESKVKKSDSQTTEKKAEPIRYKIKSGDTLSAVARRYNVTVQDIMKWNNKKSAHRLSIDEEFIIYPKN